MGRKKSCTAIQWWFCILYPKWLGIYKIQNHHWIAQTALFSLQDVNTEVVATPCLNEEKFLSFTTTFRATYLLTNQRKIITNKSLVWVDALTRMMVFILQHNFPICIFSNRYQFILVKTLMLNCWLYRSIRSKALTH